MPLISVVMITYGHENYIEQAINGVLMQECDFEVELIIANDCSPDNTDLVVKKIIEEHPNSSWIQYSNHEINLGMMPNFIWALKHAEGKYIALCEGDDYWTDPLKLQKQVDFMESNLDFSMCFHPVHVTMASKDDYYNYNTPSSDVLFLKDIVKNHYIPTCSLLFRNGYFPYGLPIWFSKSISGDIPLEILLASKGKTKYLVEKMACYRRNLGSVTQNNRPTTEILNGYVWMYIQLSKHVPIKYALIVCLKAFRCKLQFFKYRLLDYLVILILVFF